MTGSKKLINRYSSYKSFLPALKTEYLPDPELTKQVADIICRVKSEGDKALFKFTEKFDKGLLKN